MRRSFSILVVVFVLAAGAQIAAAATLDVTFQHPLGFYFHHPSDWRQQIVSENMLALVPGDVMLHQGQPAEIILVTGDDAGGIENPADPRVAQVAGQLVASALPFLRREGEVETRDASGHPSAVLTWTGESPTGLQVRARMWIGILEGSAVAIFAAAPVEVFATREPVVQQIFDSCGYTQPEGDSRLFGKWRYTSTYMSGEFSMVEQRILTLQSDGTFLEGNQLTGGLQSSDDSGQYTGDVGASSRSASDAHGRWRSANKHITLEWNGGRVEEWEYLISGDDMMFRSGKTKKVWVRLR